MGQEELDRVIKKLGLEHLKDKPEELKAEICFRHRQLPKQKPPEDPFQGCEQRHRDRAKAIADRLGLK